MSLAACILALSASAFDTAEAAAVAGLKAAAAMPRANSYEAAGVVYQCGDKFTHSEPVQGRSRFSFSYSATLPAGAVLAAIFHTHPSSVNEADPAHFSDADMQQQRVAGVPSYILVMRYREVRALVSGGNKLGKRVEVSQ